MPRKSQYTDKQKATFAEIAMLAQQAGRSWDETLQAVKKAGYKGELTLPNLRKLVVEASEPSATPRKPGRPKGSKNKPKVALKRRGRIGRPKGSKNIVRRGPGRPRVVAGARNSSGLAGIEAIVQRMVEQRVRATVARTVKVLKAATSELSSL